MRNIIILGSGRSGTSMVAGTLSKAGYHMGDHHYPPRQSNPKGFFEDKEINEINEDLISLVVPNRPRFIPMPLKKWIMMDRPLHWQRWLAHVPMDAIFPTPEDLIQRIQLMTDKQPFCYKDPRFSYTLSVWRPYLINTVFICVFRHPADTAESTLRECKMMSYLNGLNMDFGRAIEIWIQIYNHILKIHSREGEWLFLHYLQLLSGRVNDKLEQFTGAYTDQNFPEPSLFRSKSNRITSSNEANLLYKELCSLANYQEY